MASWVLVPCLVSLREEFNELAPNRDKSSDGSIGDDAHSGSSSDHNPDETGNTPYEDSDSKNEVHAIDVDDDLKCSGWSMQKCVDVIVGRHKRGEDDRLQNIIYNRRIWSKSWGWTSDDYTGSNPHDQHAHFSALYSTSAENDTSPWGLVDEEDDGMANMTQDEFNARMDSWWLARMAPPSGVKDPINQLSYLRRAPWNQVTDADAGRTMYQVIHDAAACLPLTETLSAEVAELRADVCAILDVVSAQ